MKPKPTKQNRSQPIELDGGIEINLVEKNRFGWIARATCNTVVSDASIQTNNPLMLTISKDDFDLLQPGDQIRFLAVVTRPRKVKSQADTRNIIDAQPGECIYGMPLGEDCHQCPQPFNKDSESAIAAEFTG